MNLTSQLRSQHARLLSMVADLESMLREDVQTADVGSLHPKACHLLGWALVHLEFARTEVYPTLRDGPASQIGQEIEQIRPLLTRFEARFRQRQAVQQAPNDFVSQVSDICRRLRERIAREQALVYPVTDKRSFLPVNRLAYMTKASTTRH